MALSPMMQQYMKIKEQYKDTLVFYRLGDFYEMFFDDAIVASRELELTLTGRDCGLTERAPMCGVPFHAVESYIAKLSAKLLPVLKSTVKCWWITSTIILCRYITVKGLPEYRGWIFRQVNSIMSNLTLRSL